MKKSFLRIEHNDGIGIFRDEDEKGNERKEWKGIYEDKNPFFKKLARKHNLFPNLYQDGFERENHHFCGYRNITQIRKWFTPKQLQLLKDRGCRIYKITASEVDFESEYQIAFRKENVIDKLDITDRIIK